MGVKKVDPPGTIHIYVFWPLCEVDIRFKTDKHRKLKTLMKVYCQSVGVAMETIEFIFDGQPINGDETPSSLEMEEGDVIEVYQL